MTLNDLETCGINIDTIMIANKDLSCPKIDKVSDDGKTFRITEQTQCVGLAAVQVLLQTLFLFSLLTSVNTSFVSGLMTSSVLVCHWETVGHTLIHGRKVLAYILLPRQLSNHHQCVVRET